MANNTYITGDIHGIPAARQKNAGPLVQAVEPVKGEWNQSNNWATSFDKYKDGWPLMGTHIFSIAQCMAFRGPPRVRGIMLSRDDISIGGPQYGDGSIDIKARITYGSGGFSQQLLVDWGAGTVINLPASTITVEAVAVLSNDNGSGNPLWGGILGCTFSNELIPKTGLTTLTDKRFLLNVPKEVPPLAVGFIIANTSGVPQNEILKAWNLERYVDEPVAIYPLAFSDQLSGVPNWLPSSAAYLQGSNSTLPVSISWILNV
jgi:hypothetical protein